MRNIQTFPQTDDNYTILNVKGITIIEEIRLGNIYMNSLKLN